MGAAEELIEEGVNGWTFDAQSTRAITKALEKMAALTATQRTDMGNESSRILEERCPTEAFGQGLIELLTKCF